MPIEKDAIRKASLRPAPFTIIDTTAKRDTRDSAIAHALVDFLEKTEWTQPIRVQIFNLLEDIDRLGVDLEEHPGVIESIRAVISLGTFDRKGQVVVDELQELLPEETSEA